MYQEDAGLAFLEEVPSKDLDVLVGILTTDKDGEPRLTEELTQSSEYQAHAPDHHRYWESIAAEIQCFGANTFATMARGGEGVLYKELLCEVCDKMKVNYNKKAKISAIERNLLMKVLTDAMEEMTQQELKELCISLDLKTTSFTSEAISAVIIIAIRQSGFAAYQMAVIVANAVARQVAGRGLAFAANAALTRAMGIIAGPIGLILTALWTMVDIAGPAYRVTIPATIVVAYLRIALEAGELGKEGKDRKTSKEPPKHSSELNPWENTPKKDADGVWEITMNMPTGAQHGTLDLRTGTDCDKRLEGRYTELTGKLRGEVYGEAKIKEGTVDGRFFLAWKVDITTPMEMTLEFTATVDDDEISGDVKIGGGDDASGVFVGTRLTPAEFDKRRQAAAPDAWTYAELYEIVQRQVDRKKDKAFRGYNFYSVDCPICHEELLDDVWAEYVWEGGCEDDDMLDLAGWTPLLHLTTDLEPPELAHVACVAKENKARRTLHLY